ncbi:conjugal transfer protein TrbD [Maridesulfovibrio ferrireducens]|uniref:conjugal transfer protein TrbD n=1 Tax=Maridesulfovibrio ferrireducens TaxID=246191 RepID=UPI001A1BCF4F|nr:conjugal transfer protein TrbD [Maridesulfovibrio ferrireducens]MBI9112335.1 VirB3 family type IV secretion system protein [Maridesulfovibrio ferrireducens]
MSSQDPTPEKRIIPINRSLHKHALLMGAERDLVMYAALVSFVLAIGGKTLLSAGVAVVFWIGSVFLLQIMGRSDPQKSKVWRRQNALQTEYPAKSTPWRR